MRLNLNLKEMDIIEDSIQILLGLLTKVDVTDDKFILGPLTKEDVTDDKFIFLTFNLF